MKSFKRSQLVTIGALVGMGLFNPASVEILRDYFEVVYTGIFLVCSVWVMGFILKKALTPETVNIPEKSTKKSKVKYETA